MKKQSEILNIQTESENEIKSEDIRRYPFEGTPFYAIGSESDGFHLICGKHRLTEHAKTISELYEHIEKNHWELVAQLIAILVPHIINDNKN